MGTGFRDIDRARAQFWPVSGPFCQAGAIQGLTTTAALPIPGDAARRSASISSPEPFVGVRVGGVQVRRQNAPSLHFVRPTLPKVPKLWLHRGVPFMVISA